MAAEIGAQANVMTCSRPGSVVVPEKKARPVKDQAINCPRCNSTNIKFCYYNNYSLTQPRYFCKTCRRYWTEGGTLRNVPVGGGSRKNRRSSSSSSSSSQKLPDLNPNFPSSQDLDLGFQTVSHDDHHQFHGVPQFLELSKMDSSVNNDGNNHLGMRPISAMELLRTGIASRGFTSFISSAAPPPDLNPLYTSSAGFPFQELNKPTTSHDDSHTCCTDSPKMLLHPCRVLQKCTAFGVSDVHPYLYPKSPCNLDDSSTAALNGDVQEHGGARTMFPLGGFKQLSSTYNEADHHQAKGLENNSIAGYNWNGMLGGGSW